MLFRFEVQTRCEAQICLFPSQLVCLVIMDSVLLVFSVIDSAYLTAFEHPEPAWYKALFPYFWHPFKNMATTCCAYMVVAVAAERYTSSNTPS